MKLVGNKGNNNGKSRKQSVKHNGIHGKWLNISEVIHHFHLLRHYKKKNQVAVFSFGGGPLKVVHNGVHGMMWLKFTRIPTARNLCTIHP